MSNTSFEGQAHPPNRVIEVPKPLPVAISQYTQHGKLLSGNTATDSNDLGEIGRVGDKSNIPWNGKHESKGKKPLWVLSSPRKPKFARKTNNAPSADPNSTIKTKRRKKDVDQLRAEVAETRPVMEESKRQAEEERWKTDERQVSVQHPKKPTSDGS